MNMYSATVRVNGQFVKTAVVADSLIHARLLFQYQYGMDSLLSTPTQINETDSKRPPTPEQARVKALQVQADRAKQAVKAEKAKQKIRMGQLTLKNLVTPMT